MKKTVVLAIFSILAFLSGTPEAKATSCENVLNPMKNNRGMEDGTLFADCAFNDANQTNVLNSLKNAISNY